MNVKYGYEIITVTDCNIAIMNNYVVACQQVLLALSLMLI
jgi:hypothetical protein